jgi:hypothetical protein
MAFHDTPETRAAMQVKLRSHMENSKCSFEHLSKFINDNKVNIAPAPLSNARRPAIDHDVIKRFTVKPMSTHAKKVEILYRLLVFVHEIQDSDIIFENGRAGSDKFFGYLHDFFGVRDRNDDLCHSIVGPYIIYFRSEDQPDHVVCGTLKFAFDDKTDSFIVTEHQEDRDAGIVEDWNGYYFARRDQLVVILRGMGRRLDHIPKFYILRTPYPNKDGEFAETTGRMLKLGPGGAIYHAGVLLRRNVDAAISCDRVPNHKINENILRQI